MLRQTASKHDDIILIAINANKEVVKEKKIRSILRAKNKRETKIDVSNMNRFESTLTRIGSEQRLNQMVKSCLEAQVYFNFMQNFDEYKRLEFN